MDGLDDLGGLCYDSVLLRSKAREGTEQRHALGWAVRTDSRTRTPRGRQGAAGTCPRPCAKWRILSEGPGEAGRPLHTEIEALLSMGRARAGRERH